MFVCCTVTRQSEFPTQSGLHHHVLDARSSKGCSIHAAPMILPRSGVAQPLRIADCFMLNRVSFCDLLHRENEMQFYRVRLRKVAKSARPLSIGAVSRRTEAMLN